MGKKYPERYEPGELAATRKRLGDLSEAEAKKYAAMLGGEIGIEKKDGTEASAEEDTGPAGGGELSKVPKAVQGGDGRFLSSVGNRRRLSYPQRIRVDFLCADGRHRLKTFGNALLSFVPCLFPRRDYVNPFFVEHLDELVYTNVENLVVAVRALISISRFLHVDGGIPPYHRGILETIAGWNIEGLLTDISHLRRKPKNRQCSTLRSLARNLYLPIVKLATIEDTADILRALRKLYGELLKKGEVVSRRKRIDTYYEVAKQETAVVFERIKPAYYPLLLKVLSIGYRGYVELFSDGLTELTAVLKIPADKMVSKERLAAVFESAEEDTGPAGDNKNDEEEKTDKDGIDGLMFLLMPRLGGSDLFTDGLKLLEAMYPGIDFSCLRPQEEQNEDEPAEEPDEERAVLETDLYVSFGLVLPFPKGIGLCNPDGALIKTTTLVLVIQELLQGFRAVDFGVLRDEHDNPLGIEQELRDVTGDWYRYGEEILGKQFLPMLYEYCRNLEQDLRFRGSPYGKRLHSELHWLLKHYFLPFLIFEAESGSRPPAESPIAPLPDAVSGLLSILSALVEDNLDPEAEVSGSVKNPKAHMFFEVPSLTSKRLGTVLEQHEITPDNVALIGAVYMLVRLLNDYINNPLSAAYTGVDEQPALYRSDEGSMPVYNPGLRDFLQRLLIDGSN